VSVNKHLPHVFVLPEDDANRQLANGFQLEVDYARQRRIKVLPVAGGWAAVLKQFLSDQVADMEANATRSMVLLIDLDAKLRRLQDVKGKIPGRVADRVFVLCTLSKPEALRSAGLGTFESIGSALALNRRDETDTIWKHKLLRHNAGELARLRERVRPILF
jgi:hypothetical protein